MEKANLESLRSAEVKSFPLAIGTSGKIEHPWRLALIVIAISPFALIRNIFLAIWIPACILIIKILNFFPHPYLRMRRGCFQTATVFFEHPASGRKVALVGTIHLAEKEYFVELSELIRSLSKKGWAVMAEKVQLLDPEEEVELSEPERKIHEQLLSTFRCRSAMANLMGFVNQRDHLWDASWKRTDMTERELIASIRKSTGFFPDISSVSELIAESEESPRLRPFASWLLHKMFGNLVGEDIFASCITPLSPILKKLFRVIIGERNAIAHKEIVRVSDNVVATWGAAHIHGLSRLLRQSGFAPTRKTWHTAYRIRRYTLIKAIRDAWRAPQAA